MSSNDDDYNQMADKTEVNTLSLHRERHPYNAAEALVDVCVCVSCLLIPLLISVPWLRQYALYAADREWKTVCAAGSSCSYTYFPLKCCISETKPVPGCSVISHVNMPTMLNRSPLFSSVLYLFASLLSRQVFLSVVECFFSR